MTRKMKKRLRRILIGTGFFAAAILIENLQGIWGAGLSQFSDGMTGFPAVLILAVYLTAYMIIGGDVVREAVTNIGHGQVFDENFLMAIATVGAFFVGDYPEAVAVMLFYQVGELFQDYAVNRSRRDIAQLMDIRPDYANVLHDGTETETDPDEVAVGEHILVKPGERIPLDGRIIRGQSSLDTMALTGESLPREVMVGDEVISGCINLNGVLEVEVTKVYEESTVSKILELVENASSRKAKTENFITRFARFYTPIVVCCAAALALLPPIFLGGWSEWIYRGLTFLVVSCPCAVVISVPLSFFGGLGGASKAGILVKGSNYLEALAQTRIVVMDKTGTLTKGTFAVQEIQAVRESQELLEIAAHAEYYSNHPISLSIKKAYGQELDSKRVGEVKEFAGYGVQAAVDGHLVLAGNQKLMEENGILLAGNQKLMEENGIFRTENLKLKEQTEAAVNGTVGSERMKTGASEIGTLVHISADGEYLGCIRIADEIKPDAAAAVRDLKKQGVQRIIMLTGDRKETAEAVAAEIGLTEVHANLLPGDKVDEVEKLFASKPQQGNLVFVGDGINDAPVLARADIGIAMGGLGSDAAIEAADVVIMTDEPSRLALAMRISRKTLRIVRQNIVFAIGIKVLVLLLAAVGYANMWLAVFADVGVAVLAILNAMRAMQVPNRNTGTGIDAGAYHSRTRSLRYCRGLF